MTTNQRIQWQRIPTPVILRGDSRLAYRDPALHFHDGVFRIFVSITTRAEDGSLGFEIAVIQSSDLISWSDPVVITPVPNEKNLTAIGNIVRCKDSWIACLSSYPVPPTGKTEDARAWTMQSHDLESWSEPKPLLLKGPGVTLEKLGRVIDPYLFQDKDEPGKWWCVFKQGGIVLHRPKALAYGGDEYPSSTILLASMTLSYSYDLENWSYVGANDGEENYCMLVDDDEYVLVHSPANGIGFKRSSDLLDWRDVSLVTLGQRKWPWAQGRITAGHVLDLRAEPGIGKFLMVFHGCSVDGKIASSVHGRASLGIAWSDDLERWFWPEGE